MVADKGKRVLIHLSSSDDDGDDDDEDRNSSDSSSSASEYECDEFEVDDDEFEEDDSFDSGRRRVEDDQHSLCQSVIQFLQEKCDLLELSIKACKAYLQRHGLRVTGNKDECVRRIQEHWRIKDGEAEVLYPRSSFVINCTGDVCKGDIVLFQQKVYGSFDKVTRNGKLLGKRTVAGRVVKESYGAAKQQHTFTVEVLWSKGMKQLPPLCPLLVKGRNLYRLKTFRQPWKDEGERIKVLDEKHRRGTVARLKRDKRKKAWSTPKGGKSQKFSHCARPSRMNYPKGGKHFVREQGGSSSTHLTINRNNQQHNVKQGAYKHSYKAKFPKPFPRHQKLFCLEERVSALQSYHAAHQNCSEPLAGFHHRSMPVSSTSAPFQGEIPYHGPMMMPAVQYNSFSCSSFHACYDIQSPWMAHADSWQFFPSKTAFGQWQLGLFSCSIPGCKESGSNKCVIAACWRCCRREGIRCNVHR